MPFAAEKYIIAQAITFVHFQHGAHDPEVVIS